MALIYFLIAYNASLDRLVSCEEYLYADSAMRDFAALEGEHRADSDIQVVLLTADSLETLRSTHPHYFADSNASDALTALSRA